LYSKRGECERKKRKLQQVCCRLHPFICWIIKRKDLAISLVDVAMKDEEWEVLDRKALGKI
jgi:hypothetical protein